MQVLDSELSLGAKNHYVHMFKQLVYYKLGLDYKVSKKYGRLVAEFDKDLYNKAMSLPDISSVTLDRLTKNDKFQYGKFLGGSVFLSFEGNIDPSRKSVKPQEGWVTLDRNNPDYCLFRNDNFQYIISLNSFVPENIVSDFFPLYHRLYDQILKDLYLYRDQYDLSPLSVSLRNYVAPLVVQYTDKEYGEHINLRDEAKVKLYQAWKVFMNANLSFGEFMLLMSELSESDQPLNFFTGKLTSAENDTARYYDKLYGLFPDQFRKESATYDKTNPWDSVQAVVYELPEDKLDTKMYDSPSWLICYQNPDSISYDVNASFESQSPRGTQQPFQFYQGANAISMSFDLRWHYDEVKTFTGRTGTLQEVAETAERFTRPWELQNGSIRPKLCCVILPGIQRIGYITGVNITYDGDMTGSALGILQHGDDFEGSSYQSDATRGYADADDLLVSKPMDYTYNSLKINFTMLIVQDIKLAPYDGWEWGGTVQGLNKVNNSIPYSSTRNNIALQIVESDIARNVQDTGAKEAKIASAAVGLAAAMVNLTNATSELVTNQKAFNETAVWNAI